MNTQTKMFCGCSNDAFGKEANTLVCPVCMGHPGTLPVINGKAVEKAIRASLALKCEIQKNNHMSRKNYFYPDLPTGYQISQYDFPLALKGTVQYEVNGEKKSCGLTRLHMENDAGKLMHRGDVSLVDYNRAGTPLMEIVTDPDLRSAEEASAFVQELRRILIAVDSSEADMFKGMMRFDASVSLRPVGDKKLYPRVEIKNLNSFKALEKAIAYEQKRLTKLWEKGEQPKSEVTVGWLDDEEKTVILREKESAADYRYFPEPDIPPLQFDDASLEKFRAAIELPQEKKNRYVSLGLNEAEAMLLIEQTELQSLFDAVYEKTNDAKRTSSLILTQLIGFLKAANKSIEEAPKKESILELITITDAGTISGNQSKQVLEKMIQTGKSAAEIVKEEGMEQISDTSALEAIVQKALEANTASVEAYKGGKQAALGAIVGWIMKETKGQANPAKVNELLKEQLG